MYKIFEAITKAIFMMFVQRCSHSVGSFLRLNEGGDWSRFQTMVDSVSLEIPLETPDVHFL